MHKGVYFGKNFAEQKKKILILGESHHGKEEDKGNSAKYNTCDVVEEYLQAKRGEIKMIRSLYFFTKITHAFDSSLNCQDTINFWNNVAFGNYIDVICGIKDNYAKSYIYENNNRDRLNKDLFEFVNKNRIIALFALASLFLMHCRNRQYTAIALECQHLSFYRQKLTRIT